MAFIKDISRGMTAGCVVVLFAGAFAQGAAEGPLVATTPFRVVDNQGHAIMVVDEGPLGPMLTLNGKNGASVRISSACPDLHRMKEDVFDRRM